MGKLIVGVFALASITTGCKSMNVNLDSLDDLSNLTAECGQADFGTGAAAGDVRAFVDAATEIATTAEELDAELVSTCSNIARAFGAPPEVLQPNGGPPDTEQLCGMVSQRLAWEIQDLAQNVHLQVGLEMQLPSCQVDAMAAAQCNQGCGPGFASHDPMRSASGAQCAAACEAKAQTSLQCSGGSADIVLGAAVPPDQQWRIDRLRYVVNNGWPMLQRLATRARGIVTAGATVVQSAEGVVSSASDLNVTAARCATEVSTALPGAVDSLQVSASASVSLLGVVPQ